jgi:hypothetical protein
MDGAPFARGNLDQLRHGARVYDRGHGAAAERISPTTIAVAFREVASKGGRMAERVVTVAEVKGFKTQSGNTRFVLQDDQGVEYTTFREEIARTALAAEGRRARIRFHERQRGRFTNVYLDDVNVVDCDETAPPGTSKDVEEVAWKTAVDAAPWLLGAEPAGVVAPDELFERLQPFKERVADDIRQSVKEDEPTDR